MNEQIFIESDNFSDKDRIINMTSSPHSSYQSRMKEAKTTVHSGQRKLLNVEIEFITRYVSQDCIVVYVGAAPGHHHRILEILFPFVFFVLYDPRGFPIGSTPAERSCSLTPQLKN